ncbi:MAG: hypothetical protein FWE60_06005, partial [Oscillospiraceae bacterium]|nr:hypothetical protein [Oscillospiraceae bacterium]
MRKISLIALLIIFALICTSCNTQATPENLDFDFAFSFTAELEYNGAASKAQFTRTAADNWTGTLSEPYALQGVFIDYKPEEMTVSYSDFAVRYGGDLPNGLPPDINITAFVMIEALESAFRKDSISVTSTKETIEVRGITDSDNYT